MLRRGFSLVELSVALVAAGLMAGLAMSMSSVSSRSECYGNTKVQLAAIKDSIQQYVQKNDRYPVPADRRLGVNSPDFGREATPAQVSSGAIDSSGIGPATVYYGALPFQALGLPTSFAADCWDNKFTYAVTKAYTDSTSFLDHTVTGAITINSNASNLLLDHAAYAVISHGADGVGAVKRNYSGSSKGWCTDTSSIQNILKTSNCALSNTIVAAEFNDGKTGHYYDDIVIFYGRPIMPLPCAANTAVTWLQGSVGPCSGTTPATITPHHGIVSVNASNPGYSGSVTETCDNGVYIPSNQICTPPVWHVASGGASAGPETCTALIGVDVATIADGMACSTYNPTTVTCRNHSNALFQVNCGGAPLTATCPTFSGSAMASGTCSTGGCQINYKVTIRNALYAQSGNSTVVRDNMDVENVGTALYAHCPLGSGWNYTPYTVTIGQATGTCVTDPEPGIVSGSFGPFSHPNRITTWDVSVNNIPTCDPSPTPPSPPAACTGSVSWGSGNACSANIGTLADSASQNFTTTATNTSGTVTVTCSNGITSVSNPVCNVLNCEDDCGNNHQIGDVWCDDAAQAGWGLGRHCTASGVTTQLNHCTPQVCTSKINGVCGAGQSPYSTVRGSCIAGTAFNGIQYMGPVCSPSCPNYATWDCVGSNGGTTAHCATKAQMGCFLEDVVITMADGSSKPVSALKPGDRVKGHTRINTVVRVPNFTSGQRVYGLNGGKKFVTGGHPLMTTNGWKAIDPTLTPVEKHNVKTTKLVVGDAIYQSDGTTMVIRSIDSEDSGDHTLFNPILNGDHTYYANGLLAHNKCNDACEAPDTF